MNSHKLAKKKLFFVLPKFSDWRKFAEVAKTKSC